MRDIGLCAAFKMYVCKKAALFFAAAPRVGLVLLAPLAQVQAQENGGLAVATEQHRVVIDGNSKRDIEKLIDSLSMDTRKPYRARQCPSWSNCPAVSSFL